MRRTGSRRRAALQGQPKVASGAGLTVSFTVTNTGTRAGAETAQVYGAKDAYGAIRHLIGWNKIALAPHESKTVTIVADKRLLAAFDVGQRAPEVGEVGWFLQGRFG